MGFQLRRQLGMQAVEVFYININPMLDDKITFKVIMLGTQGRVFST